MAVRPSAADGSSRPGHLAVAGASVRALACSARRAGWTVHAADLFGDADLRAVAASVIRLTGRGPSGYPLGLAAALATFPPGPWCYTGALENHPDVIDALAAARPLAGNGGPAVRAVRDHDSLAAAVRDAGLTFPPTFMTPRGLPTDGSFLVKPRRSAGGRGIRLWLGGRPPVDHVWQRRVAGRHWSLSFLCGAGRGRLWGASHQFVGRPWCHARPFAYCGSVTADPPLPQARPLHAARRLGDLLAGEFGLVGLVGADVVHGVDGHLHVIEINPRPTASMELAERVRGTSLAGAHLAACGFAESAPRPAASPRVRPRFWGKAVLFAAAPLAFTHDRTARLAARADRWTAQDGWPAVADIPEVDSRVAAGSPMVTVFAGGDNETATHRLLRRRVRAVLETLSAGHPAQR